MNIVLECTGLSHWFDKKRLFRKPVRNSVLHDINFKIVAGEIVSVVGSRGCGKSTLLHSIIGTQPQKQGSIKVLGVDGYSEVEGPGRDRGIVFQHYPLFPHWTALHNVASGLRWDQSTIPQRFWTSVGVQDKRMPEGLKWPELRKQHLDQAAEFLDKLGLGHAKDLYPKQLSGGMRQQVAFASAMILKPSILLLDESFGSLDWSNRLAMQKWMLRQYQENIAAKQRGERPPTFVLVTHELVEADTVSDRIIGLSRFWNWKEQGYDVCPGATIVYDDISSVLTPEALDEDSVPHNNIRKIREVVLNEQANVNPKEHQRFWDHVNAGKGEGVLAHDKR